jgi:Ser/Thr protein kinase RdoA (MazF antagonist)
LVEPIECGGWFGLLFEAVPGETLDRPDPVRAGEFAVALAAHLTAVPEESTGTLRRLADVSDDEETMGFFSPGISPGAFPRDVQALLTDLWAQLGDLLGQAPEAIDGQSMCHGDLRTDNILWSSNATFVCDWASACRAAPWTDAVHLLADSGRAAESAARRSGALADADPHAVNCYLALLVAYMLCDFHCPVPNGSSPVLRTHQLRFARGALPWLHLRLSGDGPISRTDD